MRRLALPIILLLAVSLAQAIQPQGPDGMQITGNSTRQPGVGYMLNTSRGTINAVTINATGQSFRWIGFVGNISGTVTLSDADNNSIYRWSLTAPRGEIYATRSSGLMNWSAIRCANQTHIDADEAALGISVDDPDSINRTFNMTTHRSFYVGDAAIAQNTCRATALYINNAPQEEFFQEIALYDGASMIYTGLINQTRPSYEGSSADFELIVPAQGTQGPVDNLPYYFYVELM